MRGLALLLLVLAACGPKHAPPPDDDEDLPDPGSGSPGVGDLGTPDDEPPLRSELERRQRAACETVMPRLTECAVADARAKMSEDELAKLEVDKTAPIHTREYIKTCKAAKLSSRQVRVYEVCDREETECAPLVACLENLKPVSGEQASAGVSSSPS